MTIKGKITTPTPILTAFLEYSGYPKGIGGSSSTINIGAKLHLYYSSSPSLQINKALLLFTSVNIIILKLAICNTLN